MVCSTEGDREKHGVRERTAHDLSAPELTVVRGDNASLAEQALPVRCARYQMAQGVAPRQSMNSGEKRSPQSEQRMSAHGGEEERRKKELSSSAGSF